MCMYVCSMRQITKAIEKVWDRICDRNDAVEHFDSVIRHSVLRPAKERIEARREARETVKHWGY